MPQAVNQVRGRSASRSRSLPMVDEVLETTEVTTEEESKVENNPAVYIYIYDSTLFGRLYTFFTSYNNCIHNNIAYNKKQTIIVLINHNIHWRVYRSSYGVQFFCRELF